MIDNERYLSVAVRTTLGQSISNQYIDCAGMQSVWTDFGDWEVEPDTFILQDVIGCGYFGIVWKGKQQFKDDAVALLAGQPYLRYTGRGFESCGWAPLRSGLGQATYLCASVAKQFNLVRYRPKT